MKSKRRIILIYVIIAYLLVSLTIHYGAKNLTNWYGMMIGVSLMIIAIPIHFKGKKNKIAYFISFLLNSCGVGLSVSTYYSKHDIIPSMESLLEVGIICFILVIFFSLITLPRNIKPFVKLIATLMILILFITSIVLWVKYDGIIYSLLFYFLNITYFYIVGMITASHNMRDLTRIMSIVSFGALIILSLIVLIIISEGEALEGIGEGIAVTTRNKRIK